MGFGHHLRSLSCVLNALLFGTRDASWSATVVLWLLRIITFGLLLRTYIVPLILSIFSKHIRVRSISFRSIRGLYIRRGLQTWRIDRIGISRRLSSDGPHRISIKIEGLKLEVGQHGQEPKACPTSNGRRELTLADLNPSPIVLGLWSLVASVYSLLDPVFRPVFRSFFVSCLRHVIHRLPGLTQAFDFDLQSAEVVFASLPGTRLVVSQAVLRAALTFTQMEPAVGADELESIFGAKRHLRSFSVAEWRSRLTKSTKRTWDRAWGRTQGFASISLEIKNFAGLTKPGLAPLEEHFISLPGAINLDWSVHFGPKRATIDPHGLEAKLRLDHLTLNFDILQSLLRSFKTRRLSKPTAVDVPGVLHTPKPPFIDTLSMPMAMQSTHEKHRHHHKRHAVPRLKDVRISALLSVLKAAYIQISAIHFISHSDACPELIYHASAENITFNARLSDPSGSALHREWLGREVRSASGIDPDAYAFDLSTSRLTVERTRRRAVPAPSPVPLLLIGPIEGHALASQWPLPWLASSPFMVGDPNGPLLAVRLDIKKIDVTDRLEFLRHLVLDLERARRSESPSNKLSAERVRMPRMVLDVQCGDICLSVIFPESPGRDDANVIQLRTEGFFISAHSHFLSRSFSPSPTVTPNDGLDLLPIQMTFNASAVLKSTFVRVHPRPLCHMWESSSLRSSDGDPSGDAILSLETVELIAGGSSFGHLNDDSDGVASIYMPSTFVDLNCSSDALCLELWHPNVIACCSRFLSAFPTLQVEKRLSSSAPRLLDTLPFGLSATVSLSRLVLLVTGPDLNDSDLSRGLAFRTGFSVQYTALHAVHTQHFGNLPDHWRKRHMLHLPEDEMVEAIASAKASNVTKNLSAFLRIALWGLALRRATATQYVADDPYVSEKDDPALRNQQFLRIQKAKALICLRGNQTVTSTNHPTRDTFQVTVHTPYIWGTFELVHVYCLLLAIKTISTLSRCLPSRRVPKSPTSIIYKFEATVKTAQMLWNLPKHKAAARIDSVTLYGSSEVSGGVQWSSLRVWVPVATRITKWQEDTGEKWEELLRLYEWETSLPFRGQAASIVVEGDSARFRIPFGFIIANLILSVSLTVKLIRHIAHMVTEGHLVDMQTPGAESAKSMPNLAIRIRCLCVEAADDVLESQLGLIWRAGLEASLQRIDREEAFRAKVATIFSADASSTSSQIDLDTDYQFTPQHTVTVEEARQRLHQVHAVDWTFRHEKLKTERSTAEEATVRTVRGANSRTGSVNVPDLVAANPIPLSPPLFRVMVHDLSLKATPPSFPIDSLPMFMYDLGSGLPRNTKFSLLVPMHLSFTLSSLRATLRDYPLSLLDIPATLTGDPILDFDADLVVGEEMGVLQSVDWIDCTVLGEDGDGRGTKPFSVRVPKTIMPVKTYANPTIRVTTDGVTAISWGVSSSPATQDLMRVVDTLTSAPRDPSPGIGFWDKMRLVFHWKIKASFTNDVRLYMKGSRDPYNLLGNGAGFTLSWKGNPEVLIGHRNEDRELIQVVSDSMIMGIPEFESSEATLPESHQFRKICAKLGSGVRFGVGFALERSCGPRCSTCSGTDFHRTCRFYDFRPHYEVMLEKKPNNPHSHSPEDSYHGFRSDFIHMSISLASSTHNSKLEGHQTPSSFHLTPKGFAHFWSWWALFDGSLSLPVRQGTYYPSRTISPKFGRHLATVKYRLSVARLFISHAYIDDSRASWVDGITPFVGVKAMIDQFKADMHQRDQEMVVPGLLPGTIKVSRHKKFYAAEVVLKGLDLRALLATFIEPLKQAVPVSPSPHPSKYRTRDNLPSCDPCSIWIDGDDFVETDWTSSTTPTVHLLPIAACPCFTYFKRNSGASDNVRELSERSKFGAEDTHVCLLGKEESIAQIQIRLASERVAQMRLALNSETYQDNNQVNDDVQSLRKKITLLENYITQVTTKSEDTNDSQSYYMPSDAVSPDEWADFDNVYQIHCPKIFMDAAIRDIIMQYYYCSRARRGYEYHMAARAVKFIRDQAEIALATSAESVEKRRVPASPAQVATALRNFLIGDNGSKPEGVEKSEVEPSQLPGVIDPLSGWTGGVSLRRSHFCLLLKPQIVLRSEATMNSVCVLAAVQAKLQSFTILDSSNAEDPVCGKVMTRNYSSLNGLQAFSPAKTCSSVDGCVPLEVLIDYRCESNNFDRLVPQTDATFHYDKFNRLRLRNNVTSVARTTSEKSTHISNNHLRDQTDLVQVHIPRFTVSATDRHFQDIANIVTKVVLFSDAAFQSRLEKLETFLFTYDFTDLSSAANVVTDLQGRLRSALDTEQRVERDYRITGCPDRLEILKLKAHIFLLSEELNFLFDAIKLAQDRIGDHADQKSALLLHASSSEISWRMLDEHRLLAKVAVRDIDYSWLSRQDSSTVNTLTAGDLQAFDGSPNAVWAEIICKHADPANHPLLKRGLFVLASWTVLSPVGGIAIYQNFELNLHPMRVQIDARVGTRIMEYVWPARKHRKQLEGGNSYPTSPKALLSVSHPPSRSSLDSPRALQGMSENRLAPPPLRKLGTSRSFTDLRSEASEPLRVPTIQRTRSSQALRPITPSPNPIDGHATSGKSDGNLVALQPRQFGDAAEMKTRSSQKSFVLVRISSLHLLLSIMKEESFECRDARIRTRELEYRNQTWSFEELAEQFIPSDMSWKGWMKVAFHQPLIPVLPVARELIRKTKWVASKGGSHQDEQEHLDSVRVKAVDGNVNVPQSSRGQNSSSYRMLRKKSRQKPDAPASSHISEPGSSADSEGSNGHKETLRRSKVKVKSLFSRRSSISYSRKSTESDMSHDLS